MIHKDFYSEQQRTVKNKLQSGEKKVKDESQQDRF